MCAIPTLMLSVLCALLAIAPPARADEAVAQLQRDTPIAAYGGVVAWSAYDVATRRYALMLRRGRTTLRPDIPPATRPFDVSLGPATNGHVVAVYTRCALAGRRCDIYRYDLRAGGEQRLTAASSPRDDEAWPAIWGRRLTFVRRAIAHVDPADLHRDPRGTMTMDCDIPFVATLPAGRPRHLDRGGCARTTGMSIRADRIVQVTDYFVDFNAAHTNVRLLNAAGGRARVLADGTSGLNGHSPFASPSQSATAVWLTRIGDRDPREFLRIDIASGRMTAVSPNLPLAGRVARDEDGTFWYVQAPAPQDEEGLHGFEPFCVSPFEPCRLVRASASPFSSQQRTLPPVLWFDRDSQAPRVSGHAARVVVRRGRVVRTLALAGISVALRRGVPRAGSDEFGAIAFERSGAATVTDAAGRWSFEIPAPSPFAAYVAFAPALFSASDILRLGPA